MSEESSAFQAAEKAHVLQLVAEVQQYQALVEAFVAAPGDHQVYDTLSRAMDHLRLSCIGMLEISVPYLGLLVAHSELVRARWRVDNGMEGHVDEAAVRNREASARLLVRLGQSQPLAN